MIAWIAASLATLLSGCVTVYQPVAGLDHPVVVDPTRSNLNDTRIDVVCLPGGGLGMAEANVLCNRVRSLFENQGALVRNEDEPRPVHLTMELQARKVHESFHPLTWLITAGTFTILPGVTELTFAQDVTVRDHTGFLLSRDTLKGRIVRRFGVGNWLATAIADLWRPPEQDVGGDAAGNDLSDDLYAQLSQIAFDARVHAQVLQVAAPRPAPSPPGPASVAPELP